MKLKERRFAENRQSHLAACLVCCSRRWTPCAGDLVGGSMKSKTKAALHGILSAVIRGALAFFETFPMNHTLDGPDTRWQFEITQRAAEAARRAQQPAPVKPAATSREMLFGLAFAAAVIGGLVAVEISHVLHF